MAWSTLVPGKQPNFRCQVLSRANQLEFVRIHILNRTGIQLSLDMDPFTEKCSIPDRLRFVIGSNKIFFCGEPAVEITFWINMGFCLTSI